MEHGGIVVIGFCEQDYLYFRNHMRIPFVVYDGICEKSERIFNIALDNYNGGLQMGRYFKEAGHRKALCVSDNNIGIDLDRMEGFREGFTENVDFLLIPMKKEERWKFYFQHLEKNKKRYRCLCSFRLLRHRPDVFFEWTGNFCSKRYFRGRL